MQTITNKLGQIKLLKYFNVKLLFLVLWMSLIFLMSDQVATTSSGMSSVFVEPIRPYAPNFTKGALTFLVRKSAHIFMYFVLGILLFNVLKGYKFGKVQLVSLSIIFAFLYAVTDEIHQSFVSGRSSEFRDVIIDTIGAALGITIFYVVIKRHTTNKAFFRASKQ